MTHRISKKSVFLVDGSSFLYRAYYGLKPLYTTQGKTVHAVYGFCRMIKKLIDDFEINHLVIVWDSKGKTDRHVMYEAYKATRQAPPSDIFEQKDLIQEFINLVGIAQLSQVGIEADDLLYSAAVKFNEAGYQSILVTSDKDMRQAIDANILIFDPFKNTVMDQKDCEQRYGFQIQKMPFYFSIIGDSSDNIPGVKGIGEKGATQLVQQFESLQELYQNLDKVEKARTRELLLSSKDNAFLSYKLFLLQKYSINLKIEDVVFDVADWAKALPFFLKLEFKSLAKDIEQNQSVQQTLFSETKEECLALHDMYRFECVTDLNALKDVCEKIKKIKSFAIDTETDGLDPMQATLVGISIAFKEGFAYYIPLKHENATHGYVDQISLDEVKKHFGPLLQDENIKKYMHHAKFDELILIQAGFVIRGIDFDTVIAASLLTKEWEKNGLKELSKQFFNETMMTYQDIIKEYKAKNFAQIPIDVATNYAACDAHQTLKLVSVFTPQLEQQGMKKLFYEIEMPVNQVLVAMQKEGIFCDVQVLSRLSVQVNQDLKNIENKIFQVAGKQINLNSPKQVRELLFDTLKLPPQKKSGKGDVYSTDAQVLQALTVYHEIPLMLLAHRELFKLKSTYIDALPDYVNPETGHIHTSWNQTIVATGRISSSNPNLQNIPKSGLEYAKSYDVDVRSAFKAKRGWSFISADYSQIELRILAHLSQDKNLLHAFKTGQDIHVQTAATMFGIEQSQVTSEQRAIGKRINFSILYGLTAYGLSRDMLISYAEAKKYIELYFQQYPGVQAWMDSVVEQVKKTGYTQTLYGRRRYLPGIYEKNKTLFDVAKRVAINTPAQGTAAEIIKIGMTSFQNALLKDALDGKILLQIHDELLVTCPDDQVDQTVQLLKKSLIQAVDWDVKLEVAIRTGKSWKEVSK